MARPRCSVYIAASLDGFIARKSGAIDWLSVVARDGEDYGFGQFFASIDTLAIGRKTYETALGFDTWPYAGKRCVVLTHSARESIHGETFFAGRPSELVERLGRDGAAHVYVDGGATIASFLADGVVDDVTVSVIPILLGEGVPLAPAIGRDVRLRLQDHRAFGSGLVQLTYRTESAP